TITDGGRNTTHTAPASSSRAPCFSNHSPAAGLIRPATSTGPLSCPCCWQGQDGSRQVGESSVCRNSICTTSGEEGATGHLPGLSSIWYPFFQDVRLVARPHVRRNGHTPAHVRPTTRAQVDQATVALLPESQRPAPSRVASAASCRHIPASRTHLVRKRASTARETHQGTPPSLDTRRHADRVGSIAASITSFPSHPHVRCAGTFSIPGWLRPPGSPPLSGLPTTPLWRSEERAPQKRHHPTARPGPRPQSWETQQPARREVERMQGKMRPPPFQRSPSPQRQRALPRRSEPGPNRRQNNADNTPKKIARDSTRL